MKSAMWRTNMMPMRVALDNLFAVIHKLKLGHIVHFKSYEAETDFINKYLPKRKKILFVGSNPSTRAISTAAFTTDTQSGQVLQRWVKGIPGILRYENIVPQVTKNNRPLHPNEILRASVPLLKRIKEINPDRLVALGKVASNALTKIGLKHFAAPHPSGRNRKLNDKAYVEKMLKELKQYCE